MSVVYAYHGTSRGRAASILSNGFLLQASNHSWLGTGVYFFQDNREAAAEWAATLAKQLCDKPAVLMAEIDLRDCLDLAAGTALFDELRSFLPVLERVFQKCGTTSRRFMDHRLIDAFVEDRTRAGRTYCSVRATFQEGVPLFPNSGIFRTQSITISVRDLAVITAVEESLA